MHYAEFYAYCKLEFGHRAHLTGGRYYLERQNQIEKRLLGYRLYRTNIFFHDFRYDNETNHFAIQNNLFRCSKINIQDNQTRVGLDSLPLLKSVIKYLVGLL